MWNLNMSIIVVVFMSMGIIYGILGTSISTSPEKFEENLSLKFEESMDNCDDPEYGIVDIDKKNFEILRENFVVSNNVKSMNLEDKQIMYIFPNAFKGVPNLSCLNIRHNSIENIFEIFLPLFKHTLLKKLNLAHTTYQDNFTDYKCPDISEPKKKIVLKSFIFLPNVTHLDISDNRLCELPRYLNSSFPNLTHIYLSDNALRKGFFSRIPLSTQYLYLERNRDNVDVTSFPRNVCGLYISENNFVWNFAFTNLYPNLQILSMRKCNNFAEIFPSFDSGKIVDLDISSNNLSIIQADLFKSPESLQRLSLDRNFLHSILFLESFVSLTDLSIAYNKLDNVTSNLFTNMKNLRKLNLRGNFIALIDKDAFLDLKMLEKLDLAENRLTKLPDSWMNTLIGLRYLNLKSNPFSSIESMSIYTSSPLNNLVLGDHCFKRADIETLKNLPLSVQLHLSPVNNSTCTM